MMKAIGTAARRELEKLLNNKIFLSLFVKVKPNWREDPSFLNSVDWRSMVGSEDQGPKE
jgi:GTP-binding protein Era